MLLCTCNVTQHSFESHVQTTPPICRAQNYAAPAVSPAGRVTSAQATGPQTGQHRHPTTPAVQQDGGSSRTPPDQSRLRRRHGRCRCVSERQLRPLRNNEILAWMSQRPADAAFTTLARVEQHLPGRLLSPCPSYPGSRPKSSSVSWGTQLRFLTGEHENRTTAA